MSIMKAHDLQNELELELINQLYVKPRSASELRHTVILITHDYWEKSTQKEVKV